MLKRIAVHLDQGNSSMPRLVIALNMAKKFEAEIQCIYTGHMPPGNRPQYVYDDNLMMAEVIDELQKIAKIDRDEAEIRFMKEAADRGIRATWVSAQRSPAEEVSAYARLSDLLLISQENKRDTETTHNRGLMEQIVFSIGRPILALPESFSQEITAKKTLLCWDGSREAARALADAAPFFQTSKDILILAIKEKSGVLRKMAAPMEELKAYCRAHSYAISKHIDRDAGEDDIGEIIKRVAAEEKVDLIVMGAYGHSRLRELVLGGATRSLLKESLTPVLFSH